MLFTAGLAALTQPFKLRLARSEHEKQLKDYSHNVVLIEPLASMTAVEDFLFSKVFRSSASPPPSRTASVAQEVPILSLALQRYKSCLQNGVSWHPCTSTESKHVPLT